MSTIHKVPRAPLNKPLSDDDAVLAEAAHDKILGIDDGHCRWCGHVGMLAVVPVAYYESDRGMVYLTCEAERYREGMQCRWQVECLQCRARGAARKTFGEAIVGWRAQGQGLLFGGAA